MKTMQLMQMKALRRPAPYSRPYPLPVTAATVESEKFDRPFLFSPSIVLEDIRFFLYLFIFFFFLSVDRKN